MKARILVSFGLIFGLAAVAQTAPPSQKVAPVSVKAPITKAAPATRAAAHAPAAPATAQAKASGKRDPFVSPVREGGPVGGPNCTVGKKCLAIDTIQLRGIVRAPSGSIAVVESSTRKVTYFLRESDSVFNGYVVKITADSVMFRENVMDRTGKQSTREIVKRVSAPPV
jgi:Tfp pilus assembly protein PilP